MTHVKRVPREQEHCTPALRQTSAWVSTIPFKFAAVIEISEYVLIVFGAQLVSIL